MNRNTKQSVTETPMQRWYRLNGRIYYRRNRESITAYRRKRGEYNRSSAKKYKSDPVVRARINEKERIRRQQPHVKQKMLNDALLRRYGITIEERDAMITERMSKCDICHRDISKRPNIDHDPATMRIRGILCNPCNQAIGLMRHNPEILRSAISYLEAVSN